MRIYGNHWTCLEEIHHKILSSPPLGNYQPPPPGSPPVVPTPETEFPDDQGTTIVPHFHAVNLILIYFIFIF
jgi:hypothetical protein